MSDDSRVQQLLDELFDTHRTPEEVCVAYPKLLPEVRERWRQICRVEADLDAVFPPPLEPGSSVEVPTQKGPAFPSIPGYELEAILGRGGMGIVFRARDMRLKRLIALKMVLAGQYAGPQERLRFQREAEAVAGLKHPNIVQIHDIGDSDDRPYFTMEYVDGGSLSQKLAGRPQLARDAALLLATLAVAVQAAHTTGIVHRDLKPANVLLTSDGTPKISDFGLARRVDGETALTRTGIPVGTPSYMAPEQAVGIELARPAVDIYALGAILYELLTGRPPFTAETAADTIQQVITQEPVLPSRLNATVPRDLETICLKCLRKEPGQRFANAAALADDLHRFLRGDAISARPEGPLERLVRRVRRRPAFSVAVAVSILLTIALIAGGAWTHYDRAATAGEVEAERLMVARAAEADQAATERAVETDLLEMEDSLMKSSWPEARGARDRAKSRLGNRGSAQLHHRIEQGTRDLDLVAQWQSIRLSSFFARAGDGVLDFSRSDGDYEAAFRGAGFGQIDDDVEVVAARIRTSRIRSFVVDALDQWAASTSDNSRRKWLSEVAGRADADPVGWRALASDIKNWKDEASFTKLVETAPRNFPSLSVFITLELQMTKRRMDPVPLMKRFQQTHSGDFWINLRLADCLYRRLKPEDSIRYYQAALAVRPKTAVVLNNLGHALLATGRHDEALEQFRLALDAEPTNEVIHTNYALALSQLKRHDDAIAQIQVALRYKPDLAILRFALAYSLNSKGRLDDAVEQLCLAVKLDPKLTKGHMVLRDIWMRQGKLEESRGAWEKAIEANPLGEHGDRYGYAELCLFLGKEKEYCRARESLLERFGMTTSPQIAERTARACLLLPVLDAELRQAVALADRAVAGIDRSNFQPIFLSYLFVKGLAEYREAKFDQAIATMRGDASRTPGPAPRLVLAMALHRSGQETEARKTLAAAVLSHDWKARQIRDQEGWVYHVLRREAESMILPNLQPFLEGKYQPEDNDERMAFLGVCQFINRTAAMARLYDDAFNAKPNEDLIRHRYNAARAAAMAGCGRGDDAAKLGELEHEKWRSQARSWLRAELADWKKLLDNKSAKATKRDVVRQNLTLWQTDADLAGLREPSELLKLPADEREDCIALWDEVSRVIKASQAK